MIRRLAHLCFDTHDLQKMVDFYSGTLGLPVKFTLKNNEGQVFGYYFACGDSSFLEIFDQALKVKQWGGTVGPLQPGNQYCHFCLEVTGLRDLKAKLERNGAKISEIRTGMDHSLQAWTNDPDGNSIELMEYTSQSLQLQPSHS